MLEIQVFSHSPNICRPGIPDFAICNLWRCPVPRPAPPNHLIISVRIILRIIKINNMELGRTVFSELNQKIVWFDVEMYQLLIMEKGNYLYQRNGTLATTYYNLKCFLHEQAGIAVGNTPSVLNCRARLEHSIVA